MFSVLSILYKAGFRPCLSKTEKLEANRVFTSISKSDLFILPSQTISIDVYEFSPNPIREESVFREVKANLFSISELI